MGNDSAVTSTVFKVISRTSLIIFKGGASSLEDTMTLKVLYDVGIQKYNFSTKWLKYIAR